MAAEKKTEIKANVPIRLTGVSRAELAKQIKNLIREAGDNLEAEGCFIEYHQGLPGEPDVFKTTVIFKPKP